MQSSLLSVPSKSPLAQSCFRSFSHCYSLPSSALESRQIFTVRKEFAELPVCTSEARCSTSRSRSPSLHPRFLRPALVGSELQPLVAGPLFPHFARRQLEPPDSSSRFFPWSAAVARYRPLPLPASVVKEARTARADRLPSRYVAPRRRQTARVGCARVLRARGQTARTCLLSSLAPIWLKICVSFTRVKIERD